MGKKLLLVGLDVKLADIVDNVLKQTDFEFSIKSVNSVSAFRTSIKLNEYDMVIFDVDSDVSYQEILSICNQFVENIPFVAILSKNNYYNVFNILKSGFDSYCFKEDLTYLGLVVYKELTSIEKKRKEDCFKREQLKEMERLSITIESIGDGVITTDQHGKIIMINKAAIDITQWNSTEAIGKSLDIVFNIFDKITGERAQSPFERVMTEGCSLGLKKNTVLFSKEGKEMYVSASSAPIKDIEDNVIGVVVVFRDITRIKSSEEELRKLSMVVEQSPSLVLVADAEGHVEYANPKFIEVSGYTLDEIKEKGFTYFVNKKEAIDLGNVEKNIEWHGEFNLRKKNAQITWQLAAVTAIRNTEGIITNWLGISEDITERKKYEDKLATEQKKLQTIFDTAPVGMLIVDRHRYIKKANASFANILHKATECVIGKRVGEAICCRNFSACSEDCGNLCDKGCGISVECRNCKFQRGINNIIINKTEIQRHEFSYPLRIEDKNEIVWVSLNAVPIIIDDEECALVLVEDITSKKRIEEALNWSRNFYITLFEEFPASIWRSGKDGVINYFNKTWLGFTGRKMEEELNGGWIENMHPDDVEHFEYIYSKAILEHRPYEIEFRLKRSDGEYRWIVNEGRPFSSLEDDFAGFIGVCTDITEKRQVTENLRIAKEAAEAASKSKSEFLANMSHEIRTPLNGIIGMTNLTLQSELSEDQRENLNIANSCADLLLCVINDILDYSKIEAGKMTIDTIQFDFYKLLDDTFKAHLFKVREKGLKFKYQIREDVPRFVTGDPTRLRQVLNNLISNAVKFTDFGGVKICSSVDRQFDDKVLIKFTVSDTGIGIGKDELQRLFKSFSQVDGSITRKYGGTGLGLAITKQLVEMMSGEISVESEKNKGSVFTFTVLLSTKNNEGKENFNEDCCIKNLEQKLDKFDVGEINAYREADESMEEGFEEESEKSYDKYMGNLHNAIQTGNMVLIEKAASLIKDIGVRKENDKVKSLAFKIQLMARRNNIEKVESFYAMLCEEI